MTQVAANGIEIEYERAGDPQAPALLFIMGLGAQLCGWDDDFIAGFVQQGLQAVRLDNRDCGLSTKWPAAEPLSLGPQILAALQGQSVAAPYALTDLADDVVGLLDALAIKSCHVVGASMGGMIAQLLAIRAPERVRSLTSIMSTTGERGLPPPEARVLGPLFAPVGKGREGRISRMVDIFRTIGSPPPLFDEARVRARLTRSYDRSFHPAGVIRQLLAILSTPGRAAALGAVQVPALIIHGDRDPLVPLACGQATAAAIPGARLLVLPGVGHELPSAVWPQVTAAITAHVRAAEQLLAGAS